MEKIKSYTTLNYQPRFIRLRDAPHYLGMDRSIFEKEVRPCIIEFPIGKQGIAFDALDLNAWADQYKNRKGRPGANRRHKWEKNTSQDFKKSAGSGTSTKGSTVAEFVKVVEQVTSKKPRRI